jgi:methyl-accepting chemotaxis protein
MSSSVRTTATRSVSTASTGSAGTVDSGPADLTEDDLARVMRLITIVSTQTRLLALNACRAATQVEWTGEMFSVVAHEVPAKRHLTSV